jgi:tRNA A-37 threonylcarbamoyl transferase component Bud32
MRFAPKIEPAANRPADKAGVAAPRRWFECRVRPEADAGSDFNAELARLLHNRLRLASTIIALAYAVIVALHFVRPVVMPLELRDNVLNYLVALLIAGVAALLWRRRTWDLCQLRVLETVFFGIMTAHFVYVSALLLKEAADLDVLRASAGHPLSFRLALLSFMMLLRWCLLIVIYGTFVPNTARRTGIVVGFMALLPMAILLYFAAASGLLAQYVADVFPFNVLVLAMSAAVAVFGSHKISTLSQEAYVSRQLGQYRLKSRLGIGGMGDVYLAEHLLLKRPCVVKLIRSERAADPETKARFEREVKAMATLTHWNTVAVFDYGHAVDGTFYYVMEYLPGLSLQEMVANFGPMPPARVVYLLRQVCAALNEAHAIGLIHRDIKPSNILVCPWGGLHDIVKLLDFGLVLHQKFNNGEGKLTREGHIVGTPDFMSPEQAQDGDQVDPRTDIYSLGAVAYYLLTGQTVFPRKTAMQVVVAHAHEPPPNLPPAIPPGLNRLVQRCLEKRPSQRFASVAEVDAALAAVQLDLPWTESQAAAWWAEHRNLDKAAQIDTPTLVTIPA